MKINMRKRNTILAFMAICLVVACMAMTLGIGNFAYAKEYGGINGDESKRFENIVMLSSGGGRSSNEAIISGKATPTISISDLTNVQYIPNSNYFLINPKHAVNNGSDNPGGTCTTVAMQMLMGYHNYYSDRRLIPEVSASGRRFLNADFGNLDFHPAFERDFVEDQGCERIGTEDGVYEEIFDLTWISDWFGIGQAVGLVKDGAIRFMNNHTPSEVRNNVSISSGLFSAATARADIDAGNPIVLGMARIEGLDWPEDLNFHVVPAYGYAKLDGVDGFLVHYGWGDSRTQVWVPSSWFTFQIRMSINHTHSLIDTGINRNDKLREIHCNECGYTDFTDLYNTTNIGSNEIRIDSIASLNGARFNLTGNINIPSVINGRYVTQINDSAFANSTNITSIFFGGDNIITTPDHKASYNNAYYAERSLDIRLVAGVSYTLSFDYANLTANTVRTNVFTSLGVGETAFAVDLPVTSSFSSTAAGRQIITFTPTASQLASSNKLWARFIRTSTLQNVSIEISNVRLECDSLLQSIGSSAFANNSMCTNFVMPSSVTNICDSAFSNCSNLITISSIDNIQTIGDEAFKGCNLLSNISLPESLVSIGEEAFANCDNLNITVASDNPNYSAQGNILYNKDKTTLIASCKISADITILDSVTEISPYAFEGNSNLSVVRFKNTPTIGAYAFANCLNMHSVYFDSYTIPTMGPNSFAGNSFVLYTPYVSQEPYSIAFAGYTDNIDSIEVQITFISDEETIGTRNMYFGSIIDNLIEPVKTGYDFCGWYDNPTFNGMAYENGELLNTTENFTLYAKWEPKQFYIIFAGEQSDGLEPKAVVYDSNIGELPLVTRAGYTFLGWKSQSGQYYNEEDIWTELNNITLTSDWNANEYTITYNGNGGTPSLETQSVVYDTVIYTLASCQRTGYTFLGWNTSADGSGQAIAAPFIYDLSFDELYAQWEIIQYSITYNLNGGTQAGSNPTSYTILSDNITFNSPSKTGYAFDNWKNEGIVITGIPTGSYGDLHLEAYWNAEQYRVTLDPNEGIYNGVNPIIVTYDSSFSISSTPTKTGYTFEGWYDSENVKYTTLSGESTKPWDKAYDTTLYAHWAVKSYEIQINNNGTITWLGPSGLSDEYCSIEYGTVLSAINFIATFKQSSQGFKEGQIFDHFEYDGTLVNWESVPDLGENGAIITIIPEWILEEHTIYFNTLFSATFDEIVALYGSTIELPTNVNRPGNSFKGWYTSAVGGTKVFWTTMPDLTPTTQNNGSTTLFAQYDLIWYSITYNMDGGTNSPDNPSVYNIESVITFRNPTKGGYIFNGWFLDANKTIPIIELREDTGHKQIYAKWSPITYTIRFNSNYGAITTIDDTHTYNVTKNLRTNTFTRTGYTFAGWARSSGGNVEFSNSQSVLNLTSTNNAVINLYAKWNRITYTISYNANGGSGSMSPSVHTYDVAKNLNANAFTRTGYTFAGWATSSGGNVVYTNSQSVLNLTSTNNAIINLYAKWNPITYTISYNANGGSGSMSSSTHTYNVAKNLNANAFTRVGYTFAGWARSSGGNVEFSNSQSILNLTSTNNATINLYAKWNAHTYTIYYIANGGSGSMSSSIHTYDVAKNLNANAFTRTGYTFVGWSTTPSGSVSYSNVQSVINLTSVQSGSINLYAKWQRIMYAFNIYTRKEGEQAVYYETVIFDYDDSRTYTAPNISGYSFDYWESHLRAGGDIVFWRETTKTITLSPSTYGDYTAYYKKSCVAEGSLITLADGSQKPVEQLTGNELLLVWNLHTGMFDVAPILFIDSDSAGLYDIVNLYFSDGTIVKVIAEHAFWDFDLNKYVFLRNDAAQYIGHWFNKQITNADGELTWTMVQLIDVVLTREYTTAWSPVTYGHLCYYVNGMLSMPGATEGLINIFDVDAVSMQHDMDAFANDIVTYGLFTYEEFAEIIPIPEIIFEAFNGQYLKVSIGKGLIDMEKLIGLIESYAKFFPVE